MIKPENVPETVWRAAMSAYHKTLRKNPAMAWQEAVVAMLSAWPGGAVCHYTIADDEGYEMVLPLPFPQENEND